MNDNTFTEISQLSNMQEVFDLINTKYPNWIIYIMDKYSIDYPHLQSNWKIMTDTSKTNMKKIIIVSNFENDEQFAYAELLTHTGFVVRIQSDLIPCIVCNSAIASENTYNKMKEYNNKIPNIWNNKCTTC